MLKLIVAKKRHDAITRLLVNILEFRKRSDRLQGVFKLLYLFKPEHFWFTEYICCGLSFAITLQWHHNEHEGLSRHQPHECLFNSLFRRRSKKTSKIGVTARSSIIFKDLQWLYPMAWHRGCSPNNSDTAYWYHMVIMEVGRPLLFGMLWYLSNGMLCIKDFVHRPVTHPTNRFCFV